MQPIAPRNDAKNNVSILISQVIFQQNKFVNPTVNVILLFSSRIKPKGCKTDLTLTRAIS